MEKEVPELMQSPKATQAHSETKEEAKVDPEGIQLHKNIAEEGPVK